MIVLKNCFCRIIFLFLACCPTVGHSSPTCRDIFSSRLDEVTSTLLRSQDLMSDQQARDPFTRTTLQTSLGMVSLRLSFISDLANLYKSAGRNPDQEAHFVNDVLQNGLAPATINESFLSWIVSGFQLLNPYGVIDFQTKLEHESIGRLLEIMDPKSDPSQKTVSITDHRISAAIKTIQSFMGLNAQLVNAPSFKKIREAGKSSPFNFASRSHTRGDLPYKLLDYLPDLEVQWLFRILMREGIVREALIQSGFPKESTDLNETVFFISAFPELFSLHRTIEELGFKFKKYSLTDGYYTQGDHRPLYRIDSHLLTGSLILTKNIDHSGEKSTGSILIRGSIAESPTTAEKSALDHIFNASWVKFLQQYKGDKKIDLDVKYLEDFGYDLSVKADGALQLEATAEFFLFVARDFSPIDD